MATSKLISMIALAVVCLTGFAAELFVNLAAYSSLSFALIVLRRKSRASL
jgi:hypothetical protein